MKIVFIHNGIPFDGDALSRGPLGGTETALIGVSRELAQYQGVEVIIYTNTPSPGIFDGVCYRPLHQLSQWPADDPIDVLISIRQWLPFCLPLPVRRRIYFSPDSWDQPFLHGALSITLTLEESPTTVQIFPPEVFMRNVDEIFCVGHWQAEQFAGRLNFPREKIRVTANGFFPHLFNPRPLRERTTGLIYTSTPFRGLEHLVDIFPAIVMNCPQARLEVCSGMGVYGLSNEEDKAGFGSLYRRLQSMPQTNLHGSIRQAELADLLCRQRIFVYPNTFDETFCIAVLEAQAAGLPVVTSRRAALAERVTHGVDGFLIDGDPSSASYQRQFVDATCRLLTDDDLWTRFSLSARAKAAGTTYEKVAQHWMEIFKDVSLKNATITQPSWGVSQRVRLISGRAAQLEADFMNHFLAEGLKAYGALLLPPGAKFPSSNAAHANS